MRSRFRFQDHPNDDEEVPEKSLSAAVGLWLDAELSTQNTRPAQQKVPVKISRAGRVPNSYYPSMPNARQKAPVKIIQVLYAKTRPARKNIFRDRIHHDCVRQD